jgi:hypothetical protein
MEQQNWLKDGISQLSSDLVGETSLIRDCQKAISFTARYIKAGQGCLYVYDTAQEWLKLYGSFAFVQRDDLSNTYKLGEGVIGQAALEKKPILLKYIAPEDRLIMSGTTSKAPLNIYALPLIYENELYGVLEVASLSRTNQNPDSCKEANRFIAQPCFLRHSENEVRNYCAWLRSDARGSSSETQRNNARKKLEKRTYALKEQQQHLQPEGNEELQHLNAHLRQQQQLEHSGRTPSAKKNCCLAIEMNIII